MLPTIRLDSPSYKEKRTSPSNSVSGERKYLQGKRSKRISDYKAALPRGVSPSSSAWDQNPPSVPPAESDIYFSSTSKLGAGTPDVSIAQPAVCIAAKNGGKKTTKAMLHFLTVDWNPPGLPLITPLLTGAIDGLLRVIKHASRWILIQMSGCSSLDRGQLMNHMEITVNNVQTWQYINKGWVAEPRWSLRSQNLNQSPQKQHH